MRLAPRPVALVLAASAMLAPSLAGAVDPYHWRAISMDANTRAFEESKVGYGDRPNGAFSAREEWQDLRPATGRQAKANAKLLTPYKARAFRRTPLRWQPSPRLGGLGRELERSGTPAAPVRSLQTLRTGGSEAAPRLDRLFAPRAGSQGVPAFGRLTEGAEPFSLGLAR